MQLKTRYPKFLSKALFNTAKHTIIPAGRQVGKTYNSAQWLTDETIYWGCRSLWVDTIHQNIDKYIDRYFRKILGDLWQYCKYNSKKKVLQLPNGSIDFGSAQKPENLEGFNYKRYILNEAGIILKKSSLWDNTLYPMIKGDDVQGKIIGTPKGRNKFHELAVLGRSGDPDYQTYSFSVYDSPYWTTDQIETVKRLSPEMVFKQEYMGEFIEGEGMVFRNIKGIVKEHISNEVISGRRYVMGVDLAKHVDFTVIIVIDTETNEVVYRDRFNQVDWVLQKERIRNTSNKWNNASLALDSTGNGDSIFDDLVSMGLNVTPYGFSNSSKAELINNLSVAIENQELWIPNDPVIIDELEVFEYEVSKSGNVRYSAPEGLHDDVVIALGLAWSMIKGNKPVVIRSRAEFGI